MNFQFEKTRFEGLVVIKPFYAPDDRGFYRKQFEWDIFRENGLSLDIHESSDIFSYRGALRGLHYQTNDSQGKLLHVLKGCIFDVALDLRPESATFGQWCSFTLNENDMTSVYIPEGFAHGFLAVSDKALFTYMCTGRYDPESCGGILWNDPELGIPWPIRDGLIMTEKDRNWPTLAEYCRSHGIQREK